MVSAARNVGERMGTTQVDDSSQMMPSKVPANANHVGTSGARVSATYAGSTRGTTAFGHGEARELPVTQWEPGASFSLPSRGPEFLSATVLRSASTTTVANRFSSLATEVDDQGLGGVVPPTVLASDNAVRHMLARVVSSPHTHSASCRGLAPVARNTGLTGGGP